MTRIQTLLASPRWAALVLMAVLGASPALAEADGEAGPAAVQARYQRDLAACHVAPPATDKAACLREAEAVRASRLGPGVAHAPQRTTDHDTDRFARNALKRCEPLPAGERLACQARIQGQGTRSGSVDEGGILREWVNRDGDASRPTAAASSAASD